MTLLYLLSGFAGLLYEIVWLRLLALELGHTSGAISTVLAAFMGGLAAGAFLGGRASSRLTPRRALHAYALLELAVAATALALPFTLPAAGRLLSAMYDGGPSAAFAASRVALCLVLVSIPAALMGATYPIAIRACAASPGVRRVERRLYAWNTVGAALGAAATGFVFLPALGGMRTTWIGMLLNLTAAIGALYLARRPETGSVPSAARSPSGRHAVAGSASSARPAGTARIATVALFASGFVALLCEVAWTRVFAMVLGPTIYAFSTMLVAFVGGIAIGASLGVRLSSTRQNAIGRLAWCLLAAGAGTAAGLFAVDQLPLLVGRWVASPDARFGSLILTEAALASAMLLPTTIPLGAAFPLGLALTADGRGAAADAGYLYAVNTTGAIAGSLAAGFGLVPAVGLRGTLLAAGVVACLTGGSIVFAASTRRTPLVPVASAAVLLLALAAAPRWNDALLSSGAYKYAAQLRTFDLREGLEAGSLLYYREGAAGTVSVRRSAGILSLAIDGKVDASTGGDMLTQKLLAHLPLLMHPNPKRVGLVGLGSGVTAGAALTHPIEQLEVIEISPEVVAASRLFDAHSGRPLDDARTRLIVGDARTHLALRGGGAGGYDVIISEPSNPWMAGIAALFTREFFETAAAQLAAGGIMCQWAHTYDISDPDLRAIVGTFRHVFPETTLWLIGDADLLLIGRLEAKGDPAEAVGPGFRRASAAADAASVGVTSPFAVLSLFAGDAHAAAEFAKDARIETDDRLSLEFSGPRNIVGKFTAANAETLRAMRRSSGVPRSIAAAIERATPADWASRGAMLLESSPRQAYDDFRKAVAGGDDGAWAGLRKSAMASGRIDEAVAFVKARMSSATAMVEYSKLSAATGWAQGAAAVARAAVTEHPMDAGAHRQMASLLADAGDVDGLTGALERLRELDPAGTDTRYYTGVVAFMREDFHGAVLEGESTLSLDPRHARAWNLVGAARASLGDVAGAQKAFEGAIAIDPKDPSPYVNLGQLHLRRGDAGAALTVFGDALSVQPDSADALEGLAAAFELRGDADRAGRIRSRPVPAPRHQ